MLFDPKVVVIVLDFAFNIEKNSDIFQIPSRCVACIRSVFKHTWTHHNTGLKKKQFASKFKSTLHNLAANSITSQMEPERTTHAKCNVKKENRYFANRSLNGQ